MSPATVCKWRARFVAARVNGLRDEPRPGAPRRIDDTAIEALIVRTLETTPRGATHWSAREMANATGFSHMLQSAVGGMALSIVGMLIRLRRLAEPVAGAIFQEVIDLAAVLNVLRTAVPGGELSDY